MFTALRLGGAVHRLLVWDRVQSTETLLRKSHDECCFKGVRILNRNVSSRTSE
jgi:hypothetical protein